MIYRRELARVLPFHVLHERLLGVEEHLGVALLLLSQGRMLAAVIVVSGVDEQIVGEGAVSVVERVVLADRVSVGEVGAPAGPYQQGVGGEDAARQHDGDEVLGMPWCVDELERKVADPEAVAVLDPDVHAARRGFLVHHDLRRCLGLEFPGSRDVICVRVGVNDVSRLQSMLEDIVEHRLDHLQLRIDNGGRTDTGDDVAETSALDAELLEEVVLVALFHWRSSLPTSLYPVRHPDRVPTPWRYPRAFFSSMSAYQHAQANAYACQHAPPGFARLRLSARRLPPVGDLSVISKSSHGLPTRVEPDRLSSLPRARRSEATAGEAD